MIHPELYLNLNYVQKVYFSIAIIMIVFIIAIIIKMKNKTKTKQVRQVNHNETKNAFKIDYDKFIRANFKKQEYLFENKNRASELIRLLN